MTTERKTKVMKVIDRAGRIAFRDLYAKVARMNRHARQDQGFFNHDIMAMIAAGELAMSWDAEGNSYLALPA